MTSLLISNPHNYPCPQCRKRLTLDKTGRRYFLATLTASGLYALTVGTASLLTVLQGVQMRQVILVNLFGLCLGFLFLLPFVYIGWKRSRFIERKKLEHIRHSTQKKVSLEKPPLRQRLVLSLSNS